MQHDPRVPGDSVAKEALFAFTFGGLSIAVMGALASVAQAPLLFPSLGPTAFLLFHRPTASAASPRNTLSGHLIGVISGAASLWICGLLDAPSVLEGSITSLRVVAAALSLAATSGLMVLCRRGHPPAGATTLIVALGFMTTARDLIVLMIAVALLTLLALALHRLAGTPLPTWSPVDRDHA